MIAMTKRTIEYPDLRCMSLQEAIGFTYQIVKANMDKTKETDLLQFEAMFMRKSYADVYLIDKYHDEMYPYDPDVNSRVMVVDDYNCEYAFVVIFSPAHRGRYDDGDTREIEVSIAKVDIDDSEKGVIHRSYRKIDTHFIPYDEYESCTVEQEKEEEDF